jgi:hypothetical protein
MLWMVELRSEGEVPCLNLSEPWVCASADMSGNSATHGSKLNNRKGTKPMTIILCATLIVCALLLMFNQGKAALLTGLLSVLICFGYRYWVLGDELRAVMADAMFCLALLPIGWFTAKQIESFNVAEDSANK